MVSNSGRALHDREALGPAGRIREQTLKSGPHLSIMAMAADPWKEAPPGPHTPRYRLSPLLGLDLQDEQEKVQLGLTQLAAPLPHYPHLSAVPADRPSLHGASPLGRVNHPRPAAPLGWSGVLLLG